jgi:hypothetical protein
MEVHYFTCTVCTWPKGNRFVAERLVAWRFFTVCHWSAPCGRIFKEILRNRLSLTWGWPEVLSMAPIVLILNRWIWPELFSLPFHVSLVKTFEWEAAYFWTIAVTNLIWAGIFKKSMGARHRVGIGLLYRPAMLHRLAELMSWHRFLGSTKV